MNRPTTLWRPGAPIDQAMLEYTTGEDRPWDARLLEWDVLGSLGHVEGLLEGGLIDADEAGELRRGLREALVAARAGELEVGPAREDVHTAVEAWLTDRLPDAGRRLHAGRSRNDQVACDLRLWLKDALLAVHAAAADGVEALAGWAARHADALWPGYTHQRRAMVSSAGLWAAACAEGLLDTLEGLPAVWRLVDRCPLGSAAGYGAPLPLGREAAARALGFAAVQTNVATVQNGRGKLEAAVLFWCVQVGHDLARLSSDAILLSGEDHGFLRLPAELATGSSIMPQKRNPDLFELTRARAAAVEGDLATVLRLRANLTGGYHRDFQMLKEPTMRGVERTGAMLAMAAHAAPRLEVDRARARAALSGGALATDAVMREVETGTPFRTAYHQVADRLARGESLAEPSDAEILTRRATPGGVGDLALDRIAERTAERRAWASREEERFRRAMARLTGEEVE